MGDPNESVPVSWHPFSMWFTLLLNPIIQKASTAIVKTTL